METHKSVATYYAKNQKQWRLWLQKNHALAEKVFLIIYHKKSGIPSVYYNEAVDEAICFGWIDSKINKQDEQSYYQYFARRNPKSNWSKVNKEKVERLLVAGLMAPAGLAAVEMAKQNGKWTALDAVELLELPAELATMLAQNSTAAAHFQAFPKSAKRGILEWINTAKTAATKSKRVLETVTLAAKNRKANFPQ
jgi:uncharacterized protein YdeI (YjbR/CyaY-like superfamily)